MKYRYCIHMKKGLTFSNRDWILLQVCHVIILQYIVEKIWICEFYAIKLITLWIMEHTPFLYTYMRYRSEKIRNLLQFFVDSEPDSISRTFTTERTLITERAPVASNKKSYVPRKNSIVIKVLQQLFLDGSWRGGVREIIFFRRIGEGVFFLYYFKSFNFFQVVGVQSSHTICPN